MEMNTVGGLVLVVAAFAALTLFAYSASKSYLSADPFSDMLCAVSGKMFCSEEATARASTKDLVSAINYVCGDAETPSDYVDYGTYTDASGVEQRTATLKAFYLPQGITGLQDWIPGTGDPQFIVYYEAFPSSEDYSWASSLRMEFVSVIANGLTSAVGGISTFNSAIKGAQAAKEARSLAALYDISESEAAKMIAATTSRLSAEQGVAMIGGKFSKQSFTAAIKACVKDTACREAMNMGVFIGSEGAEYTDEQVENMLSSYLEKFIACESNAICLKAPLKTATAYPLSEKCRGKYIELEKLFDRNTRMYMASPCYAKVVVSTGVCEGEVKTVEAAGWADTITILDTSSSQPFEVSGVSTEQTDDGWELSGQCVDEYNALYEGDLSPSNFDTSYCTWVRSTSQPTLEPKKSSCLKVEPIGTLGEQNFCYTPAAYFTETKAVLSTASEGMSIVCTGLTLLPEPVVTKMAAAGCWAVDLGLTVGWGSTLEASSWPHGCLKTDTPPYWTCAA